MFTGIVEEVGIAAEVSDDHLTVQAEMVLDGLKLGDSMSVNGACLTVVTLEGSAFSVDLSPETIRRTSLGDLVKGTEGKPGAPPCGH